jgi:hypothetical protein
MEKRYESLSIFEFQELFPNDESCMKYLESLKWSDGFICEKCNHKTYCKGNRDYTRQCTRCRYQSSPTSGTLFHKLKFPLLKAFYIIYYMSTNKKGITSTELSRKLSLGQKTSWLFRRKVMKAMASSQPHPMMGCVEVDEMVVGQQEPGLKGREKGKKKEVVVGIEKKGKKVSRVYAQVIPNASYKELKMFFQNHISPSAQVTTDKWKGYTPLKETYPLLEQIISGQKGNNFGDMHRVIMMIKAWLRGVHHSVKHLQEYLDAYTYRYNRNFMKKEIFNNLMIKMVMHKPCPQKLMY